jgi:feruloyl esterase
VRRLVPALIVCLAAAPALAEMPVSASRHDMGVALREWVEKGQAPREIVATHFDGPQASEGKGRIAFQRPLCPWPQVARYLGGPTDKAESFACGN